MSAWPGSSAMARVAIPIITIDRISAGLRPMRSPRWPNTMLPSGREVAGGEGAIGCEQGRHRVVRWKESLADLRRQEAVDGKVVPFEHVADGSGIDLAARQSMGRHRTC